MAFDALELCSLATIGTQEVNCQRAFNIPFIIIFYVAAFCEDSSTAMDPLIWGEVLGEDLILQAPFIPIKKFLHSIVNFNFMRPTEGVKF